jgi:excisionase family DNA binding protein
VDSPSFTTHAVARMIGVSASAVVSWIDKGLLEAHRTPGGHRRVEKAALLGFLRQNQMPIPRALVTLGRVLVIERDRATRKAVERLLRQHDADLVVQTADDPTDGLIGIGSFRPDAVVLDAQMPGLNALKVCSRIRSLTDFAHVVVVALTDDPSQETASAFARAGAAACLGKPPEPKKLLQALWPPRQRDAFL